MGPLSNKSILSLSLLLTLATPAALVLSISEAQAADEVRGLLKELQEPGRNDAENEKKNIESELMITKAETKAIEALQKILARKKGTTEEASLQHRLAEMYMRRAKTGRFFDLNRDSKFLMLTSFPVPPEKGLDWVRKANNVYTDIIRRFPKYEEIDTIVFNSAFAWQQLGKIKESENLYQALISKYPKSPLVPDAALALGELSYDQRRFALAMDHLAVVEKYPNSRVYLYALYKKAWAQYNIKDSDGAVKTLLEVAKASSATETESTKEKQNLRKESLRDLVLFVSDTKSSDEVYSMFKSFTTEEELGQSMYDLAKIHTLHGRHKQVASATSTFVKKHTSNPFIVKIQLLNVEANENLRQRDEVLSALQQSVDLCAPTSIWYLAQSPEVQKETCVEALNAKSHELANKWWDIWQKNKANTQFSQLTEKLFHIVLDKESHPNTQLRFGLAELLFQLGRWQEASTEYQTASLQLTEKKAKTPKEFNAKDEALSHDADYGALYSAEKATEKDAKSPLAFDRIRLAQEYVKHHPQGSHAAEVNLRIAVLYYAQKDIDNTLKTLKPILAQKDKTDLVKKAEDLHLDVLNSQKNYPEMQKAVSAYMATEKSAQRLDKLKLIELQTSYAFLQQKITENPDKAQAYSQELMDFAKKHPNTDLSSKALLQAAAINFNQGQGLAGAAAMTEMLSQNPKYDKTEQALMDAADAYAVAGEMVSAAKAYEKLASLNASKKWTYLETAADFYLLENEKSKAQGLFQDILKNVAATDRARVFTKLMETFGKDDQASIQKVKTQLLAMNLEPYATDMLSEQAEQALAQKQMPKAFDLAKKIMSRPVPEAARARARLVQARVLEQEFLGQSVNSSKADRMSMVLEMKVEKLEKAQTAFLSASRMSDNPETMLQAFLGIDRCYQGFIDSLKNMKLPAAMPENEQAQVRKDLAAVITPMEQKKQENLAETKKLLATRAPSSTMWSQLPGDQSPLPELKLQAIAFKAFNPEKWSVDAKKFAREDSTSCKTDKPEFAGCFNAKKWDVSNKVAQSLTQNKETLAQGLHHLALVADAQGKPGKALWLLKRAETVDGTHALIKYEKARVLAGFGMEAQSLDSFKQVLLMSMSSSELQTLSAKLAFSEGDFKSVVANFSGNSTSKLYDQGIGLLVAESLAQQGRTDDAIKLVTDLLKKDSGADALIERARLEEVYKFAPVTAAAFYEKAGAVSKNDEQKEWLKRKIEYLKINFKVGMTVTTGG